MNNLQIFRNNEFGEIRTVTINNEPYFVGKDVAEILGYARPNDAISTHCKGTVKHRLLTNGGNQEMLIIPESDLYRLIFRSKLPDSEKFTDWVTAEVLPSIRKHGMYATEELMANPDIAIAAFTALKEEKERNKRLQVENESMKPKALFADAVSASHTSILVGDMAKLLRQNGVNIGQNRLFEWLRENGFLMKSGESRNMPTQKSMDMGLFEVKERTISNPNGTVTIVKTPKILGKGQLYFINKFLNQATVNQ